MWLARTGELTTCPEGSYGDSHFSSLNDGVLTALLAEGNGFG